MVLLFLQALIFDPGSVHEIEWTKSWETESFLFQYKESSKGELVVRAAVKVKRPELKLEDLMRIYLDEMMAEVETEEDMDAWKKERALLIGKLIEFRKRDVPVVQMSAFDSPSSQVSIEKARLSEAPQVYQFRGPDRLNQNLQSSLK